MVEHYRESWSSIGMPEQSVAARNLTLFEQAEELRIAEISSSGRVFHLTPAATDAWKAMKAAADRGGVEIHIVSAYCSVDRQVELILHKLQSGQHLGDILKVLAPPGCSEHHTGRAVDIGTGEAVALEPDFELAPAFSWLSVNAHRFGFRLSFPRQNEFGYVYGPWHWCFSEAAVERIVTADV